jgi:hypothetical protein
MATMAEQHEVSLGDLPYELVQHIFSFCIAHMAWIDVARLSQSSRLLYRVLNDRRLWCQKLNCYLLYPIDFASRDSLELVDELVGPSAHWNWWNTTSSLAQHTALLESAAATTTASALTCPIEPTQPHQSATPPSHATSCSSAVPDSTQAALPTSSTSSTSSTIASLSDTIEALNSGSSGELLRYCATLQGEQYTIGSHNSENNVRAARRLIACVLSDSEAVESLDALLCCHRYTGSTDTIVRIILMTYQQLKDDPNAAAATLQETEDLAYSLDTDAASLGFVSLQSTTVADSLSKTKKAKKLLKGLFSSSSSSSSSSLQQSVSASRAASDELSIEEWRLILAGKVYVLFRRWLERHPLFLVSNVYAVKQLAAWIECELSCISQASAASQQRFRHQYQHLLALLDDKKKVCIAHERTCATLRVLIRLDCADHSQLDGV